MAPVRNSDDRWEATRGSVGDGSAKHESLEATVDADHLRSGRFFSGLTFATSLAAVLSVFGTTVASAIGAHEAQIAAIALGLLGFAVGGLMKARQTHIEDATRQH